MITKTQSYNIYFGSLEKYLPNWLEKKNYSKILVIVDSNTRVHCLPVLFDLDIEIDQVIEFPAGEKYKTLTSVEEIWKKMLITNADRSSLCINLGGGVVGDMGGYAASCYKRGIDFIQIPTTLLAQVDASVGGKVAVNFQNVKNLIGTFQNPAAVFIDDSFLQSLPSRQVTNGFAEIVKHALIGDKELWKNLITNQIGESKIDLDKIQASIEAKAEVVEQDPLEQDVRKILNFGHTIGHAVESQSYESSEPLLHGEAVYVGMICEAYIAAQKNLITNEYLEEIVQYIQPIFYKRNAMQDSSTIWSLMQKDKKNRRNQVLMSLLNGKGTCTFDVPVSHDEVLQSFSFYKTLN